MSSARFALQVITDETIELSQTLQTIRTIKNAGANLIQLRYKKLGANQLLELALAVKDILHDSSVKFLINDRIDVAQLTCSDGVHLGGESIPILSAKQLLPISALIGKSVHNPAEALQAQKSGASYLTFGHIYASQSKPGLAPRGLEALRYIVEQSTIPVFAIGGIDPDHLEPVLETGVAGIAVIGSVMRQANPVQATALLRNRLDSSRYTPKINFLEQTK